MGNETIMLATNYDPKHTEFPVFVSEKLDGVAAKFTRTENGIVPYSRQGEFLLSVDHLCGYLLVANKLKLGESLIGELYIDGESFKDISGKVRGHTACPELVLHVYDAVLNDMQTFQDTVAELGMVVAMDGPVRYIRQHKCNNIDELDSMIKQITEESTAYNFEGVIIRNATDTFREGKRSNGFQRLKPKRDDDLPIHSFEEAVDAKTKEGKGMVGRINILYQARVIGCGPGKLTHKERTEIWQNQKAYIGRIVQVQSKPDKSYDDLREPTFQRWRPDKD